jgi:hypothetical protein
MEEVACFCLSPVKIREVNRALDSVEQGTSLSNAMVKEITLWCTE